MKHKILTLSLTITLTLFTTVANAQQSVCATDGKIVVSNLCEKVGVRDYPTWEVRGETHLTVFNLNSLANISGYKGRRDFKN